MLNSPEHTGMNCRLLVLFSEILSIGYDKAELP
jgi:hypothetical protein